MHTLKTLSGFTILDNGAGWEPKTLASGQLAYVKIVNGRLAAISEETYNSLSAPVPADLPHADLIETVAKAQRQFHTAKTATARLPSGHSPGNLPKSKSGMIGEGAKRLNKKSK